MNILGAKFVAEEANETKANYQKNWAFSYYPWHGTYDVRSEYLWPLLIYLSGLVTFTRSWNRSGFLTECVHSQCVHFNVVATEFWNVGKMFLPCTTSSWPWCVYPRERPWPRRLFQSHTPPKTPPASSQPVPWRHCCLDTRYFRFETNTVSHVSKLCPRSRSFTDSIAEVNKGAGTISFSWYVQWIHSLYRSLTR